MSDFTWIFWRLGYSRTLRQTQEEYYGWWRHVRFGLFIYMTKTAPGWTPAEAPKGEGAG
jgi:hypothetical protein